MHGITFSKKWLGFLWQNQVTLLGMYRPRIYDWEKVWLIQFPLHHITKRDWSVIEADSNYPLSYFIIILPRWSLSHLWDWMRCLTIYHHLISQEKITVSFAGAVVMVMILNKSRLSLKEIWKAVLLSQGRYSLLYIFTSWK